MLAKRYGELGPRITRHSSHKSAWNIVRWLVRVHGTQLRPASASGVIQNGALTVIDLAFCSLSYLLAILRGLVSVNPSVTGVA